MTYLGIHRMTLVDRIEPGYPPSSSVPVQLVTDLAGPDLTESAFLQRPTEDSLHKSRRLTKASTHPTTSVGFNSCSL